jgi:hypothetical protein
MSDGALLWMLIAALFGIVGPAIGTYLIVEEPYWCQAPFVGCLGDA